MAGLVFPVKRRDHFMYPDAMFRTVARPTHGGIDLTPIEVNSPEPMYAIESGVVLIADQTAGPVGDTSGKDIMILGDETGIRWWYGHGSVVAVSRGDRVRAGEYVGMTGTTGSSLTGKASSTGVHLHLEAHYPSTNVEIDPWPFLKNAPDVDGSTMPLSPTRPKAALDYPAYTEKASNQTEDDVALTERQAWALEQYALRVEQDDEDSTKLEELAKRITVIDRMLALLVPVNARIGVIDDTKTTAAEIHRLLTSGALAADVNEQAIADAIAGVLGSLSDADVQRVAAAVNDEAHRRSAD